jgi:hypothetical protein
MLVHKDYMKTNNIYIINPNISQIYTNNMKCVRNSNNDNLFSNMLVYNRQWCPLQRQCLREPMLPHTAATIKPEKKKVSFHHKQIRINTIQSSGKSTILRS